MGDIGLTGDIKRLERLLALEKQRRGLPAGALVFVGMHNAAQHWWCTQQAVLKSRGGELTFFAAHLQDRIQMAQRLGLIGKLPRSNEAILDIGRNLSLADVETYLKNDHQNPSEGRPGPRATVLYEDRVDKKGRCLRSVSPDLTEDERKEYEADAAAKGIAVIGVSINTDKLDPMLRGEVLHSTRAERYPSVRWSFPWKKYTVVGVADGLTKEFAYEYKTTRTRHFLTFVKPVALAQADLYGFFFQRPGKRVQIHVVDENRTETYGAPVNIARAEETLAAFARVEGGAPAHPPKAWKCNACEFRLDCPINQSK